MALRSLASAARQVFGSAKVANMSIISNVRPMATASKVNGIPVEVGSPCSLLVTDAAFLSSWHPQIDSI
jgi:hypothetical protein